MFFIFQLFSVLFFLMLFVLGVGSNAAMASSIITVIKDKFPHLKHWKIVLCVAIFGFCIGLVYITPVSAIIIISLFIKKIGNSIEKVMMSEFS